MEIEEFVLKSKGEWNSMRSGHSLAFKQFEEIISLIQITLLQNNDEKVKDFLTNSDYSEKEPTSPFEIKWSGTSNWEESNKEQLSGSTLLIPFPKTIRSGYILRSLGYVEPLQSLSEYHFLNDGTFILQTNYEKTMTEERIWFLSKNVRCRSSVIYTESKAGIIQTSFASELKLL